MDKKTYDINLVYVVTHIPTGEEWVVLLIKDGKVYAAGWPPSIGDLDDCSDICEYRSRTVEETEHLKKEFGITL